MTGSVSDSKNSTLKGNFEKTNALIGGAIDNDKKFNGLSVLGGLGGVGR